jgi:3',5'-cyclic AMP phosphodiesterase CpdA
MKRNVVLLALVIGLAACAPEKQDKPDFTFAFLTDIHITPEKNAPTGFKQAIDSVNASGVDFVLTGGDLIMDALGATRSRADSLYHLYESLMKSFKVPVHNTVGNHELFAFYNRSIEPTDLDYGDGMFKKYFGDPWYSFDHKGWHFIVLKSIEPTESRGYMGLINPAQLEWLKNDLASVDPKTPIVVSTHIPFITVYDQWQNGGQYVNGPGSVITNGKEVMALLRTRNLKLVLQGHQHYLEDIEVDGVHFITGGAVSAAWWGGPNGTLQEGFLLIRVKGETIDWEYKDFGWEPK